LVLDPKTGYYPEKVNSMQIELTEGQFQTLLLMAGYATGTAFKEGDRPLAYRFIQLCNEINKDNPNYEPYETPAIFGGGHAGR
jgi:hypothetical protein